MYNIYIYLFIWSLGYFLWGSHWPFCPCFFWSTVIVAASNALLNWLLVEWMLDSKVSVVQPSLAGCCGRGCHCQSVQDCLLLFEWRFHPRFPSVRRTLTQMNIQSRPSLFKFGFRFQFLIELTMLDSTISGGQCCEISHCFETSVFGPWRTCRLTLSWLKSPLKSWTKRRRIPLKCATCSDIFWMSIMTCKMGCMTWVWNLKCFFPLSVVCRSGCFDCPCFWVFIAGWLILWKITTQARFLRKHSNQDDRHSQDGFLIDWDKCKYSAVLLLLGWESVECVVL